MPYALNDAISKSPFDGGIEITDQQYAEAFAAKLAGRETVVIEGALVIRDRAPTPDHVWENGAWVDPPEQEPEPYVPSTPALIATAMVGVNSGAITSVSVSAALAGVMQFGTGEYWAFFTQPQPDTDYMVLAYNGGTHRTGVASADKAETHFIIRATDFDGNPADPDCVNVEVKRVL